MKKSKLILISIFASFILTACSNIAGGSFEEKDSSKSAASGSVSGVLKFGGAFPGEYADVLKNLSSESSSGLNDDARAAFPNSPDISNTLTPKTIRAINQDDESDVVTGGSYNALVHAFTINGLRLGVRYKVEAVVSLAVGGTKILSGLSEEFTLSAANAVKPNIDIELHPVVTADGTGNVSLSATINNSAIKKVRTTIESNVERWKSKGETDVSYVHASASSSVVLQKNGVPSGSYMLKIEFLTDNLSASPLYVTRQVLNVFDGLTTLTWSGEDECLTSDGNLQVTAALCTKFNTITDFYVGGTGKNDSNSGSWAKPLETIGAAFAKMNDSTKDYTINITESITTPTNLTFTSISANTVTIRGDGNNISLSAGGSGTTLTINTPSTTGIIIENLKITGGKSSTGGGVNITGSSKVYLKKDAVITGNKSTDSGSGVYIKGTSSTVYPTLTICSGAKISGNENNTQGIISSVSGVGIYAGSYARIMMEGGEISANSAATVNGNGGIVKGGGVYVCNHASFEMTGGKLYDNQVTPDATSGAAGGAVYIDTNGKFSMSGSAYIPYGVTSGSSLVKGAGKNDVCTGYDDAVVYFADDLTPPEELSAIANPVLAVISVPENKWRIGRKVVEGTPSTYEDIEANLQYIALSREGWELNLSGDKKTGNLDRPLYVAGSSGRTVCSAPPSTGACGTKDKPYGSLAAALTQLDDSNADYLINVDGIVTNTKAEVVSTLSAHSLTITGVTSSKTAHVLNGGNGTDTSYGLGTVLTIGKNIPVTLSNLTITKGSAENGGGLNVSAGTVTLNNVTVTANKADNGGGIYVGSSGKLSLEGQSSIKSNTFKTSGCNGAGIYNKGSVSVSDCIIESNTAGSSSTTGGGVFNASEANFYIGNKGSVRENSAYAGGGFYNEGTLYLGNTYQFTGTNSGVKTYSFFSSTGNIYKNTATNGGGIYNSGTVNMRNGVIGSTQGATYKNSATGNGGGVYVASGTFNMGEANSTIATYIYGNSATSSGGGVYLNAGSFTMKNNYASILGNSASSGGGAYIYDGTLDMQGGSIGSSTKPNSCSATGNGAGILVRASADAIFKMSGAAVVAKENEVYLAGTSLSAITIPDNLEGTAPVATIKLSSYAANRQVLGGDKVSDNYKKFALATPGYYIDSGGYVQAGYLVSAENLASTISSLPSSSSTINIVCSGGSEISWSEVRDALWNTSASKVKLDLTKTTITSVPTNALYSSSKLYICYLPDTVTTIGDYAFQNCSNMIACTKGSGYSGLPSVTSIGKQAFDNCTSLTSSNFGFGSNLNTFYSNSFNNMTISICVTSNGTSYFNTYGGDDLNEFNGKWGPNYSIDASTLSGNATWAKLKWVRTTN
ncbi:MAG: leucine-rich repeat protein [Treponema sp.]|nr:leucine-rich repeat protein [Treponema sp.]